MCARRKARNALGEAMTRIGKRLVTAKDPAEMRRLITVRKGLRLMLELTSAK
jgi:hypothetical protein